MRWMSGWRRWALVALVTLVLGATACGSDGDDKPAGGSEQPVVTIGVIAPLDAGLTGFGHDFRNGVQLAVDAANARAAIPGHHIRLLALDDSSDPAKGRAAAQRAVKDDTLIGVVGTYNSGVAREVAPVLDAAGITMISPGNTDPALTQPTRQWQHYFRLVAADDVQGPFLAGEAKTMGFRRAAVISETKPVSKGLADVFADRFTSGGGSVVNRQVVADGTTDFGDVVRAVQAVSPDVVFFGGEYQVAASLRKQAATAGLKAPLLGGDGIKDAAYGEAVGIAGNGDLASSIGRPVRTSESAKEFLAAYDKAGFDEEPGDFGPYAYDAANLLIAAAKGVVGDGVRIGEAERMKIRDAVAAADADGASGHLGFDERGDTRTKVLTLYRLEDGAWKPLRSEDVGG